MVRSTIVSIVGIITLSISTAQPKSLGNRWVEMNVERAQLNHAKCENNLMQSINIINLCNNISESILYAI